MGRKRFGDMNCGIAQALEALGDWWTLLIVRDAFFGARRFGDFEKSLGIAKNILSDRLQRLVEHEHLLARWTWANPAQRFEYRLTEKGEALLPLLTAMRDWSDEWVFGRGHEPVIVKDRRTNRRIPQAARHRRRGPHARPPRSAHRAGPGGVARDRAPPEATPARAAGTGS